MTTTAERVAAARKAADRSEKWTAEKSGIALSTFRRKTQGVVDFTVSELARVAKALGVRPAELLPDEFRDESMDRVA